MSCPSELTLSMFADRALVPQAAARVSAHLPGCPVCRAHLESLRAEVEAIAAALAHEPEPAAIPAFRRPASVGRLAAAAALVVLAAALVAAAPALLDLSLPVPLAWFDPFEEGAALAVQLVIHLAQQGDSIMTSIRDTAAAAVIVAFLGWITLSLGRRGGGTLLLMSLASIALALPAASHALEIRRADHGTVHVGADETVTDTLIALGDNVEIDGNVDGDLIAFGRLVTIRGHVDGGVITAGRNVTVDGKVANSILAAGQSVSVTAPEVGRNLYAFGDTVTTSRRTVIAQNALAFAHRASLSGPVGRDVLGFGEDVEVGGAVGGGVTVYADRITLMTSAKVRGDLVAHVPRKDHLTVSPGASVGGRVATELPEAEAQKSEYTRGNFYLGQVLRYAAAFVMGVILLALVPDLRRVALHDIGNTLVAGGVGLVTLVAVPIIAVLAIITIIGIPVALVGLLLWAVGLYFAKIVLGHFIGARVLEATGSTDHFAVALAIGLVVVIVAVNLPFIGFILNFLLTISGLGLLVLFLWDAFRGDGEPAAAV